MARAETILVVLNRALVALVLAAVFAIVFVNVVGRYGFGQSFAWVEEAARHLMILGAFSGAGLALREGRLVAITTL
ncbi:MAG: TRAP transporter small permease subunit, partial [Pseudomonadota bacterium]|nr:TRAP transporter small permease subunit [Pseudomonadota bacterium]